jgi:hypothetical protein
MARRTQTWRLRKAAAVDNAITIALRNGLRAVRGQKRSSGAKERLINGTNGPNR